MRFLKTISAAAAMAVAGLALPALSTPAAAAKWGADYYRVVEVPGSETVALRSGPASWAGVVAELSFDARDLRATGVTQGNWVQLTLRTPYGGEVTGWVRLTQVALDNDQSPTLFRVVNLSRRERLTVRTEPGGYGRVLGTVSSRYSALRSAGECEDGYCPVRYSNRRGTFIGWVAQEHVAVSRGSIGYAAADSVDTVTIEAETVEDPAPEATPTVWRPKRRGFLWRLFNPELVLEGY